MKIKINRNILWTRTFASELAALGVKYACISPGSRSTPLTYAFAKNKSIKTFVHIDERSSAFFALGLAKVTDTPVVLITTSGTATAELYPAIIESYQQRIPLIVCTADRPPELQNCGANQTINQNNLYKNHIRWFVDVGIPSVTLKRLKFIRDTAQQAYYKSSAIMRGPVHLNFPFRKPFEPESFTDEISELVIKNLSDRKLLYDDKVKSTSVNIDKFLHSIAGEVRRYEKGLIIAGPLNNNKSLKKLIIKLSGISGYPVISDGVSHLRFGSHKSENVIANFDAVCRSDSFIKKHKPDLILHFGRTLTSKSFELFLSGCKSKRYMINNFGDWFDPSRKSTASIAIPPVMFCQELITRLESINFMRKDKSWLKSFINADQSAEKIKQRLIEIAPFPAEARIISELIKFIPDNSNIMISNSLPVRDFDSFASKSSKEIFIFHNRGASGIDGIISTALGINAASKKRTFLLTGDLAFFYDINSLLAARNYKLPVVIILINNNGGGIFENLPIKSHKKIFNKFFKTPHNLDFSHHIKAYNGYYKKLKSWTDFKTELSKSLKRKTFSVLEFETDAVTSLKLRNQYWKVVSNAH